MSRTAFTIRAHTKDTIDDLRELRKVEAPFAMSLAINATTREAQSAIRDEVTDGTTFTVRTGQSRSFLRNSIKFEKADAATKDKLVATLRIQAPGKGAGRSGLLGFFAAAGAYRSSRFAIGAGAFGPSSVAVPIRSNPSEVISRKDYPTATRLQERMSPSGILKGALRGKRRNVRAGWNAGRESWFAVKTGPQRGIVFQRTGPLKHQVRARFVITPGVRVSDRSGFFFPVAQRTVDARFDANLDKAFARAIRTSRYNPNRTTR